VDLFHAKYHILDGQSVFSSQSGNNSPNDRHKNDDAEGAEGDDDAMIREDQLQRATKLLMEGAEMGCTNAQTALGQLFELQDDYETAKSWFVTSLLLTLVD
jgi:hypothetical protein